MDPARDVGGDFYDFFFLGEDHLCLIIADVSGKGIPGAMIMMLFIANPRNAAPYNQRNKSLCLQRFTAETPSFRWGFTGAGRW